MLLRQMLAGGEKSLVLGRRSLAKLRLPRAVWPTANDQGPTTLLVRLLGARDSFIDQLAPGEAFFHAVPVGDGFFSTLPTQENDPAIDLAGKIEQADIDVFDLHTDGIDLGEGVFGALLGLAALGFAAGDGDNIHVRPAIQKNPVAERLHLALDLFHQLLAVDGGAQKGFEDGKKSLSFVESEGAGGHEAILAHGEERRRPSVVGR